MPEYLISNINVFKKYKATFIGLLFTAGGLLLYYTFVVPLIIMLAVGWPLEVIFTRIHPDASYSAIGHDIITLLTILFVLITFIYFIIFIRQIKDKRDYQTWSLIQYLILLHFIVHPLIFYIHLSTDWSRASDGQFIFSVDETFQLSSGIFLMLGMILDGIKFSIINQSNAAI